ncbi:nitroreductase family protein [Deinococcus roseus]|uniref:Nitroreductase n=1 Tax=Deinococcus roseus TaxID=392414 RepID=A0ABQ2CUS4_9DEIO|nr:nitroreductase family protein [Deinococcus roseus]GGJ18600.1 nitroreductase [Deinococcus roseus]
MSDLQNTLTRTLPVKEAIESRSSIRQFEPSMPKEDLLEILRLASLAPSAFNAQPARFVVVENPETKGKLQAAAYGQKQVTSAPYTIVVYSDMEDVLATAEETSHPAFGDEGKTRQRQTFEGAFGGQSVENRAAWANAQANIVLGYLLIATRSLGYDSVPMLGFEPNKVKELLGLPAHVQIAALLPVGKAAEQGKSHHRHSVDRITRFA